MTIHAHPLEIIWLIVSTIGLIASASSFYAAKRDWANILRHANGSKHAVTRAIQISSLITLVVHLTLFGMAIAACSLYPPPPAPSSQSLMFMSGAIAISAILAGNAVYGRVVRALLASGYYDRKVIGWRRAGDPAPPAVPLPAAAVEPPIVTIAVPTTVDLQVVQSPKPAEKPTGTDIGSVIASGEGRRGTE